MTTNTQPDALAGKSCKSCNGFGYYVTAPSTASLGGEKIPCGACQPQFVVNFRTAEAAWSEEDNQAYLEWLGCAEGWPNDKRAVYQARAMLLGDGNDCSTIPTIATPPTYAVIVEAVQAAIVLIDEVNERKRSRAFYGISQVLHAKLATVRATLARSTASARGETA